MSIEVQQMETRIVRLHAPCPNAMQTSASPHPVAFECQQAGLRQLMLAFLFRMQASATSSQRSSRYPAGILFAGYAALAIPSNLVISLVGAKTWLPVLTTTWGVIAAAQAAVKEEKALFALRFFLGAAEAGDPASPASGPHPSTLIHLPVSPCWCMRLVHCATVCRKVSATSSRSCLPSDLY